MSFRRPRTAAFMRAVALAVFLMAVPATRALASTNQVSIFQDDARLQADPAGTLARLRVLGAQVVRVSVPWGAIAPNPKSRHAPAGFDASDPSAYPAANWRLWDTIVVDAHPGPGCAAPVVHARRGLARRRPGTVLRDFWQHLLTQPEVSLDDGVLVDAAAELALEHSDSLAEELSAAGA